MLWFTLLLSTVFFQGIACQSSLCGPTNGPCDQSDCAGLNNPGGVGQCTNGTYIGCGCANVCGTENGACNLGDCNGFNNPGGFGYV